ncbi:MAG: FAD-dependent oxidoreductase [Sulfobacillus thermotolerans]|uniref:Glutamate synthase n=1 Tax=Sulfobacillus thermotolerans TaxID=338644 RepID=A0ABM6RRF9_9FIRM|nr:glutamate synthase [Sulfobacillus thermotolerans]MCY0908728.1 FAD-dependent oxidoreductase [Sulfobacillus thermotolerans]
MIPTDSTLRAFEEVVPPLTDREVHEEALRCYYCDDAPCIQGCPTGIDIPRFIRQIAQGDLAAASRTILDANIVGATCARICPTATLCEGACVRTRDSHPVAIGRLQRAAMDYAMQYVTGAPRLPRRQTQVTGKVAIVGGGPAGLAAAAELLRHGCHVDIYEAQAALGGLDTYGIVSFREPLAVSLWEGELIRSLGATVYLNTHVGTDVAWQTLKDQYDAVVTAVGLGKVPMIGIAGEDLLGVWDALDFIQQSKTDSYPQIAASSRVVVIGAGNTAIDAATCAKRLGAENVRILYRRGEQDMPAYDYEYSFAKQEGIVFEWWTQPVEIVGTTHVEAVRCQRTRPVEGPSKAVVMNDTPSWLMPADIIIRAIGQTKSDALWRLLDIQHQGAVPVVDPHTYETSCHGLYAVGDCLAPSAEATVVTAAAQGKQAARAIIARLEGHSITKQEG